jgi:predicted transcriptional regulator
MYYECSWSGEIGATVATVGRDIAAAELDVLGALWRVGSGTVRDVLAQLQRDGRQLAYTTVLTLLGRLERKGYVSRARKDSPAHVYRPRISRDRVTADRLGALVKLADGHAAPLILQLIESHKLSASDIRQLRELLTQLEAEAQE